MCGRYTLVVTLEELMKHFMLENERLHTYSPRYNIAPGQWVPAIVNDGRSHIIGQLKWGLVPSWAQSDKESFKLINARAETVADKPAFRAAFKSRRCLIPADGFYEWQRRSDGTKQPYRIVMREEGLFAFAGLYEIWMDKEGNKLSTCTILTTEPNELMSVIHDRMPVILQPGDERIWLDRNSQSSQLQQLLRPYPDRLMEAYPVNQAVGNSRIDNADLIKRLV